MFHINSFVTACVCAALTSVSTAITIDFETEDDFVTPLVNGQIVDPAFDGADLEFGNLINITTTQGAGGHVGATIFDSTPGNNVDDPDLQVGLGNILILQDNQHAAMVAGANGAQYSQPDDEAAVNAGSVLIDFSPFGPATLRSIDVVDADGGFEALVILTDGQGLTRTYTVPANWSNDVINQGPKGYERLDLTSTTPQLGEGGASTSVAEDVGFNASTVGLLEVSFTGETSPSGGIDNIVFVPEPTMLVVLGVVGVMTMIGRGRRIGR